MMRRTSCFESMRLTLGSTEKIDAMSVATPYAASG